MTDSDREWEQLVESLTDSEAKQVFQFVVQNRYFNYNPAIEKEVPPSLKTKPSSS